MIRFDDCKFYVNKEKRKVVCVLTGTKYKFEDFVEVQDNFSFFSPSYLTELPDKCIGIATCSPEDEWNEELGKKIAYSRLKRNFYRQFFNTASKYVNTIDKELNTLIDKLNHYGEKIDKSLKKDNDWINSKLEKK